MSETRRLDGDARDEEHIGRQLEAYDEYQELRREEGLNAEAITAVALLRIARVLEEWRALGFPGQSS